jgi:S-adenosylmethionine decarboxylase proenzyme
LRIYDEIDMGRHALLNVYGCEGVDRLIDLGGYEIFVADLLSSCNAEVVDTLSYRFHPHGVAGFTHLALLTTSHCSIHTWPEHAAAAIDIFTCGEVDVDRIVAGMIDYFRPSRQTLQSVLR